MEGIVEEKGNMETPDDMSVTHTKSVLIADTLAGRQLLQHKPLSQIVYPSPCRKEPVEPCVVGKDGVSTIGEIKCVLATVSTREDMQMQTEHFEEFVKKELDFVRVDICNVIVRVELVEKKF